MRDRLLRAELNSLEAGNAGKLKKEPHWLRGYPQKSCGVNVCKHNQTHMACHHEVSCKHVFLNLYDVVCLRAYCEAL